MESDTTKVHNTPPKNDTPIGNKRVFVLGLVLGTCLCLGVACLFFLLRNNSNHKSQRRFDSAINESSIENYRLMIDEFWSKKKINSQNSQDSSDDMDSRPGLLFAKNRTAYKPLILIPGITSIPLEMWRGRNCTKGKFRDSIWGTTSMASFALKDPECWLSHLSLDPLTWKDPEGIKVRASRSWVDYIFPGYWVWHKIIENMADVGYEPGSMVMMEFDWRLAPQTLESRDGFFSRMKWQCENLKSINGAKVALICHSMGCKWVLYFLNWAKYNHGEAWIEAHVQDVINIAPPFLGVPKATSAFFSGETRDTSVFGEIGKSILSKFLGKETRVIRFFRSLGSLPSMFPIGHDAIWDATHHGHKDQIITFSQNSKQDDTQFSSDEPAKEPAISSEAPIQSDETSDDESDRVSMNDDNKTHVIEKILDSLLLEPILNQDELEQIVKKNYSAQSVKDLLERIAPRAMKLVNQHYDLRPSGVFHPADSRQWTNPLVAPLPAVKALNLYCLYGVNDVNVTEIGYDYKTKMNVINGSQESYPFELNLKGADGTTVNGVRMGSGDDTVPLVSMGYMCLEWGQPNSPLNPAGSRVLMREYKTRVSFTFRDLIQKKAEDLVRGGEFVASHVEILGHRDLITDLIRIVTKPIPEKTAQEREEAKGKTCSAEIIDGFSTEKCATDQEFFENRIFSDIVEIYNQAKKSINPA